MKTSCIAYFAVFTLLMMSRTAEASAPENPAAPYPYEVLVGGEKRNETFVSPEHIEVDRRGNLYVIDSHDTRLVKWGSDHRIDWEVDGREWGGDGFLVPYSVGVSSGIDIYMLDIGRREIFRINHLGEILGAVTGLGLEDPRALALTETGKLVVYDASSVEIVVSSPSGHLLWSFRPEGFRSKRNAGMTVRKEDELCLFVRGGGTLRLYHFMGGLKRTLKPKLPGGRRLRVSSADFGVTGRMVILDGEGPGLYVFDDLGNLLFDLSASLEAMRYLGPGEIRRWGDALYISDVRGGKIFVLKVPSDVF